MAPKEDLGSELKRLRKEKKLSLSEVGKSVNISHNFLSEIEGGKKEPSSETLRALAKFYDVDEDEFFSMLNKVPLRTMEFIEHDEHLQKLLSEVQKKYRGDPDKIDKVRKKIIKVYQDILDDD